MMKKVIVIMMLLQVLVPVKVEGTNKQEVLFEIGNSNKYELEIEVEGKGRMIDGNQEIKEGVAIYWLTVGEIKEFKVKADIGYEVTYIEYNGERIDKEREEIRVIGVSERRKIAVKFEKKEAGISDTTKKDPFTQKEVEQSKTKTGDVKRSKEIIMMIVSGVIIKLTLKRRKKHTPE